MRLVNFNGIISWSSYWDIDYCEWLWSVATWANRTLSFKFIL